MLHKLKERDLKFGKHLMDYTQHAWEDNELIYQAILQVWRHYKEGQLWLSKANQNTWRIYARKNNLDVSVDTRLPRNQKRMAMKWLRPITKNPEKGVPEGCQSVCSPSCEEWQAAATILLLQWNQI